MNLVFEDLELFHNFKSCPDINTSGIPRFTRSPVLNATQMYYMMTDTKPVMNIFHSKDDVDQYIISASVNHSPEDWTGYDPKVKSLFLYLNEKYLRDLRSGNALLLLDSSFEGYQTEWLWEWFHKETKLFGISPRQIIYVTGNMIADDTYNDWANKNTISEKMLVVPYAHFELDMGMTAWGRNKKNSDKKLPDSKDHIIYKLKNPTKLKTFACLNKRIRLQRIFFYRYLHDSGLLDKGLVSMNNFNNGPFFWEGEIMDEETTINLNKELPRMVYEKPNNELDDNFYINRFNDDICLDTFATIISEAHCGDSSETMFISEKTFKVIACRHPFMIMGNKDTLKKLRELGYKTFEGFIDESYDSLPTHQRLRAIIESIKKLDQVEDKIEWFENVQDIVEHNYENLMDKLFRVPEAFRKIYEYYVDFFKKDNDINNTTPLNKKNRTII
jgi:hypothetical protein